MTGWLHANGPLNRDVASYYADITPPVGRFDPVRGQLRADLCVVGGGITGLSAALHGAQAGLDVVVLEAARFGWGASGRNGGQVGSGFNWDHDALAARLGPETARALWTQAEAAKTLTRDLIAAHAPDADYRAGIIHAVETPRALSLAAAQAARDIADRAAPLTVLDADAMAQRTGTRAYSGGVLDTGAGFCNPLAYVRGLVRACRDAGVRLFEQSEVHRIAAGGVHTAGGGVSARFVLHATNGLGPHLTRGTAARVLPINNYIAVTEPLGVRAPMPDPVAVADSRFVVNYFWQTRDGRLVYGGGESYGKRFPADIGAKVRANLGRVYPGLADVAFTHTWGGTLAVTATRLPYIADQGQGVFAAGGYSGHGLALAGLAGLAVAEACTGNPARLDLLARLPTPALPGGRLFGGWMTAGGMAWAALRDRIAAR
jgi:gamma-glutamylputrescine oxidase